MEQDVVLHRMEAGLSIKKLNEIDTRLSGVESTLKDLIDNNEEMKEELKDKLSEVKFEMEKYISGKKDYNEIINATNGMPGICSVPCCLCLYCGQCS